MPVCPHCGGELSPEPERPERAEPPVPVLPGWRAPAWVTGDWPLVGLATVLMLGITFGASALWGLISAVAVSGDLSAAPGGAGVGAHLAFAAFGAQVAAASGGEHGSLFAGQFLLLPWAALAVVAAGAALRFAWPRLAGDRRVRIAFAGKLALVFGIVVGVTAGLVATDDPGRGSRFASRVDGGEVWFYATIIVGVALWAGLRRRGLRRVLPIPPPGVARAGLLARHGALAFATLAAGFAVVGLVWALVVADGGADRLGIVAGFPVVGFSFGAVAADVAMGATAATASSHISLLHFGLPAAEDAGAAPVYLFGALALAPGLVAAVVWRRLDRERPGDEQAALATGAFTGVGFAAAAWVAALAGRIFLIAAVARNRPDGGWFGDAPQAVPGRLTGFISDSAGTLVVARPSPGTVLGLGLFWGLAGGLGAAVVWARRHGTAWRLASQPEGGAAAPGSAEPPGPPPEPRP